MNLQEVLNKEIPITRALGISVETCSPCLVTLVAPIEKNINHKCTAFGGSLYSVAVLAGWSLLYVFLNEKNLHAHIVIQEANIEYLKPVTGDIAATSMLESNSRLIKLLTVFEKKRKARINLQTIIKQGDELAVVFNGQYVIHD